MDIDTIQNAAHSASLNTPEGQESMNWWMIIAILEMAVIVVLIFSRWYNTKNHARIIAKKEVMSEGEIDFQNAINSAFHAQELYKWLIVRCHPDRFAPNAELMNTANELCTRITKNKNNLKQLELLKIEAVQKLKISIKN